MSLQEPILDLSTDILQINWPLSSWKLLLLHRSAVYRNFMVGQFSTHTCGVLHPCNGTFGSMHFSKLKNKRYGLFTTSLSTPHFRPFESVGTSNRSKSPLFHAVRPRKLSANPPHWLRHSDSPYWPTKPQHPKNTAKINRQKRSVQDRFANGPLKFGSNFRASPEITSKSVLC